MDQALQTFDIGVHLITKELLQTVEANPYASLLWVTGVITFLFYWRVRDWYRLSKFPLLTKKSIWDVSGTKAKIPFTVNARAVVESGFKKVCMAFWKSIQPLDCVQ
jgi:hypothetical protein